MDFFGELLLGFIVRLLRDEGVAVDGDAEPSTSGKGDSIRSPYIKMRLRHLISVVASDATFA